MFSAPQNYREVRQDEETRIDDVVYSGADEEVLLDSRISKPTRTSLILTAFNCAVLLATCCLLFINWRPVPRGSCVQGGAHHAETDLSDYVDSLKEITSQRKIVTFNGTFDEPSIYRGEPNPELDAAWMEISHFATLKAPKDAVEASGKLADWSVQYPDSDKYMVQVEMVHQMHCLDVLRKWSYIDYYRDQEPLLFKSKTAVMHKDHCIEMLRQRFMCTSDTTIITADWIEKRSVPWPDFSTTHQCRDFKGVVGWLRENEMYINAKGGLIHKPEGIAIRPIEAVHV